MNRRKVLLGTGVALSTVIAGCASDTDADDDDLGDEDSGSADGNGDDEDENGDENGGNEDDSEPEINEPESQSFSGSGAAVEDGVDIEGGLTVVDAIHTGGSGNFQVHLVPSDGDYDEMFVNEIGEYEGETAALINADAYQLDVEADGDWEIEIRQPRAVSGDSLSQSMSDDKSQVFGPFEFNGSHTATGSHSGDGNFQVHVYPPEGDFGELVFNEIGEYDGETTFRHDGIGYVAVQANGDWSLDLE